jgi:hypothetical protein
MKRIVACAAVSLYQENTAAGNADDDSDGADADDDASPWST